MNRTVVNGMTIEGNHQSVVVKNGRVYIDGKLVTEAGSDFCGSIIINGNVEEVNGIKVEINGNVTGDVDGTTITVNGDVLGDVDGTSVKIMGEKKTAKSSDIADSLYNKPKEYNNSYSFDLDEYDDLKRNLEEMKNIILNDPILKQDYNNFYGINTGNADKNGNLCIIANKKTPKVTISDKPEEEDVLFADGEWTAVAGTPREENEISLKDLVKRKKKRK